MTGRSHFQTTSTFSAKVGKMAEEEMVPPRCESDDESDDESENIATLLLETERIPASRITAGYFENVVPN